LASGMRIDSKISPATCLNRGVNEAFESTSRGPSFTRVHTRLLPFLAAHSANIQDCGGRMKPARTKYGDFVVVTEAPELITRVAFFDSVASGAMASAVGVIPMPRMSTF